jgi:hypothetical protein
MSSLLKIFIATNKFIYKKMNCLRKINMIHKLCVSVTTTDSIQTYAPNINCLCLIGQTRCDACRNTYPTVPPTFARLRRVCARFRQIPDPDPQIPDPRSGVQIPDSWESANPGVPAPGTPPDPDSGSDPPGPEKSASQGPGTPLSKAD